MPQVLEKFLIQKILQHLLPPETASDSDLWEMHADPRAKAGPWERSGAPRHSEHWACLFLPFSSLMCSTSISQQMQEHSGQATLSGLHSQT